MSIAISVRTQPSVRRALLPFFLATTLLTAYGGGRSGDAGPAAPAVTSQPQSTTLAAGQSATFTVAATGTTPLAFQWQRDDVTISSASYALSDVQSSGTGPALRLAIADALENTVLRAALP